MVLDEIINHTEYDDKYVYCTHCKYFEIIDDTPYCKYEEVCDIWDCEDSKRKSERPYYKENDIV